MNSWLELFDSDSFESTCNHLNIHHPLGNADLFSAYEELRDISNYIQGIGDIGIARH
jgi:hypothetical protein